MTDDIRSLLFHTLIVAVKVDNMINKPITLYNKTMRQVISYVDYII